jgi:hypothetical protein
VIDLERSELKCPRHLPPCLTHIARELGISLENPRADVNRRLDRLEERVTGLCPLPYIGGE